MSLIDSDGYRANVAIVIANTDGKVLWAKRIGQKAWQFPQGGIARGETPQQALFRELQEETGLTQNQVEVIAETPDWLRYDLPKKYVRNDSKRVCIGQKQKWFLLKMLADDSQISLDQSHPAEFDGWCWVDFWHPVDHVISFKRQVYRQALEQLHPYLSNCINTT